jgi:hypothetical protein
VSEDDPPRRRRAAKGPHFSSFPALSTRTNHASPDGHHIGDRIVKTVRREPFKPPVTRKKSSSKGRSAMNHAPAQQAGHAARRPLAGLAHRVKSRDFSPNSASLSTIEQEHVF